MTNAPDRTPDDTALMAIALGLARRGIGRVAPNPAVGCVIARDGQVVGRGWTQPGGRPHAETEALRRAGSAARGATAYVTLEPCAHTGMTGPCAQALIDAGVERVVSALEDPDPRVAGGGHEMLRNAGVVVDVGVGAEVAREINAGFLTRLALGRPLVTLKLATTLDGKSATGEGESQWITGPEARAEGQALRARNDAILVGIGTALADDPALTCRLPGLRDRSPTRIVWDTRLRLSTEAQVVRTAREVRTILLCGDVAPEDREAGFRDQGVEVVRVAVDPSGSLDPAVALAALGELGMTRVLVESGGRLATSLLRAGLVDRLVWFRAPSLLGADARPAIGDLTIARLTDIYRFQSIAVRKLGDDVMGIYRRID